MDYYLSSCHGQASSTIRYKRYIITDFIKSLPEGKDSIEYSDIISWQKSRKVSRNTLNGNMCILRQFLKTAVLYGIKCAEPTIGKFQDSYTPYVFSDAEITKLIAAADNGFSLSRKASSKTFCFPMIIRLWAFTGMRMMETIVIKKHDYDPDKGIITPAVTKKRKQRIVPLHSSLNEQMKKYLKRIDELFPESDYLFPQDDGKNHITKGQAAYEFNKLLKSACINKRSASDRKYERSVCIHCLRHYFTITSFKNLYSNDVPNGLEHLSLYLGHNGILETEIYLKFSHDTHPESLELFDEYTSDIFREVRLT